MTTIRINRNQAQRVAYNLFDNVYYYFMPNGVMYLNTIKDEFGNYSPLSFNNLRKKLNTPEKIEAAKAMFSDWESWIDDLKDGWNKGKKEQLFTREFNETFSQTSHPVS